MLAKSLFSKHMHLLWYVRKWFEEVFVSGFQKVYMVVSNVKFDQFKGKI